MTYQRRGGLYTRVIRPLRDVLHDVHVSRKLDGSNANSGATRNGIMWSHALPLFRLDGRIGSKQIWHTIPSRILIWSAISLHALEP